MYEISYSSYHWIKNPSRIKQNKNARRRKGQAGEVQPFPARLSNGLLDALKLPKGTEGNLLVTAQAFLRVVYLVAAAR